MKKILCVPELFAMERYNNQEISELGYHAFLQANPDYQNTYVFDNDFSALLSDAPEPGTLPTVFCTQLYTLYPFILCH